MSYSFDVIDWKLSEIKSLDAKLDKENVGYGEDAPPESLRREWPCPT